MRPLLFISPNWPLEARIYRLRVLLGTLFVFVQLSGIYRISWTAFWGLTLGGALFLALNQRGAARRWKVLPSLNLGVDQLITVTVLSVSSGADGPFIFLIYLHVLSAMVFLRDVKIVLGVGVVQVINLFLSSLFILLSGGDANWPYAIIHSLGLMIIASTLTEPAKGLYLEAETDPLTGVLNRRAGLRELERWLGAAQPFNLLFADLKKFKRINDSYGHAAGDEVLRTLATRILETVRLNDFVVRYGGDEFLIVTMGDALPLTERLQKALRQPVYTASGEITVDIDLGVARYPNDATDLNTLVQFADQHMFEEKRASG